MTKLEVINETADFYTSKNRATNFIQCTYLTDDGKRCAVGRCLREDLDVKYVEGDVRDLMLVFKASDIDTLLKEKYQGHSEKFWLELQSFHDNNENWNENGLTPTGRLHLKELKKTWA